MTDTTPAPTEQCIWCGEQFPPGELRPVPETTFKLCKGCWHRYAGDEEAKE
jgi:hypothetical protein